MELRFTAVFRKVPEGSIGFVEELPGANTQASTLDEAREGLREAVALIFEANRACAEEQLGGDAVRGWWLASSSAECRADKILRGFEDGDEGIPRRSDKEGIGN